MLAKTEQAVKHLNESCVSAVVHLGDIIDGNEDITKTHADLDAVISRLSVLEAPLFHVLGNHCLSAARDHLVEKLKLSKSTYYYRDVSPKWRLIVLDTVDISLDRPKDHPYYQMAVDYLEKHKGEPNAQEWNGGLGPTQLNWLQDLLRETAEQKKFAILCGHLPILSDASFPQHTVWDHKLLVNLIRTYGGAVKAYFCGHYHDGGYAFKDGIHHVTFEAVLDADDADGSCGVVELHDSKIAIKGIGTMTSRLLEL